MGPGPTQDASPVPGELWMIATGGREVGPALVYKVADSDVASAPVTVRLGCAFEGSTLVPAERSHTGTPLLAFTQLTNRHSPADFSHRHTACSPAEMVTISRIAIGGATPESGVLTILSAGAAEAFMAQALAEHPLMSEEKAGPEPAFNGLEPRLQPVVEHALTFVQAATSGRSQQISVRF